MNYSIKVTIVKKQCAMHITEVISHYFLKNNKPIMYCDHEK